MRRGSFLLHSATTVALTLSSCALANSASLAFASNIGRCSQVCMMSTTPAADGDIDSAVFLPYEQGSHNSARVVLTPNFNRSNFKERLQKTVESCREHNKSSLWVQVPMSCAGLIEAMADCGLRFHHAEGETASLNLWLKDTENKIPEYATHHVGVGAIVVNSRNEILCVRELRKNYMPWKIPGGLSDLGEGIEQAAIREVLEETGIRCLFKSILSFRHTHGLSLGRSDLYFVCRLEPVEEKDENGNTVIPVPEAQVEEIEKAAWVSMDEYRAMINAKDGHPMMQHVMKLYDQDNGIHQTVVSSVVPGRKPNPIYHAKLPAEEI
jgi:ADP-ribose pyrophosphatase YjhB (NUDIX family)